MVSLLERQETEKVTPTEGCRDAAGTKSFSFQSLVKGGFVFPSFLSLFVVCVVFRLRYQKSEQIFTSLENG